MNACLNCRKQTKTKFCGSSCAASYNNKRFPKRVAQERWCRYCNSLITSKSAKKYCNSECATLGRSNDVIQKWLSEGKTLPRTAKKYILEEQDHKCLICQCSDTWQDRPLVFVLDHIDGNPENHDRTNLRLVCPNCDSQLPTFKAKNKGNGRYNRMKRFRDGLSY